MSIPIKTPLETLDWLGVGALHESDNLRLCHPEKHPDTWQQIGDVAAPIIREIKERQNNDQ